MDHLAVFYSGEIESELDNCLDLAMLYHCDPMKFIDLPEHAIDLLYKRSMVRLRMAQEK